jgi:hypothetical protein
VIPAARQAVPPGDLDALERAVEEQRVALLSGDCAGMVRAGAAIGRALEAIMSPAARQLAPKNRGRLQRLQAMISANAELVGRAKVRDGRLLDSLVGPSSTYGGVATTSTNQRTSSSRRLGSA